MPVRGTNAKIDHGHGDQIAREMHLDFVENPQGAQPGGMIGKRQDQCPAQVSPAGNEKHQDRKEQQELAEGRRQEFDGGLDPVEFRHLKR